MKKLLNKKLIYEVFRYLIVGGLAFIVNYLTTILFEELILPKNMKYSVIIAVAIGFIAGLVFNYIFSLVFVFQDVKDKNKGKTFLAFLIFSIIGVIGLGLTELGIYVFNILMKYDYKIVLPVVTVFVLMWNYLARKILIFR